MVGSLCLGMVGSVVVPKLAKEVGRLCKGQWGVYGVFRRQGSSLFESERGEEYVDGNMRTTQ